MTWVFSDRNWKKNCHIWNQHPWICLFHIWNQHLEGLICIISKFCRKTKMPKFWTKNALFGYFWATVLRNYCRIWNQHPQICLFAKNFVKKTKIPKCGIKNALVGYFGARIIKNYCRIWNQHPQICQKWVFLIE